MYKETICTTQSNHILPIVIYTQSGLKNLRSASTDTRIILVEFVERNYWVIVDMNIQSLGLLY